MTSPSPGSVRDLLFVALTPIGVFIIAATTELNERINHATRAFEPLQLDELPLALLSLSLALAWLSWRNWRRAMHELARRTQAEQALETNRGELRALSRRMTDALEAERRRLAQELHDEFGQTLNAIKIEAVGIRQLSQEREPAIHRGAQALIALTDRVYDFARLLLRQLRPVALDELGLQGAIEHAIAEWRARLPAIRFYLSCEHIPADLHEDISIAFYRICQESVTNALQHAGASEIVIELCGNAAAGILALSVRDNGCGTDLNQLKRGLGLLGMRERIERIGGALTIESRPGHGFALRAHAPRIFIADAVAQI